MAKNHNEWKRGWKASDRELLETVFWLFDCKSQTTVYEHSITVSNGIAAVYLTATQIRKTANHTCLKLFRGFSTPGV